MTNFRPLYYLVIALMLLSISMVAIAQEGRATFKVLEQDESVIDISRRTPESGNVFRDRSGDGYYDTVIIKDMELTSEIDKENAYGVTYPDGARVVYYPSADASLPQPDEYKLYGFIHYFAKDNVSLYFAVVLNRMSPADEEAMKRAPQDNRSLLPYGVDFIDSNGLRVGVPTFLILPHSRLIYNPDFQRFSRSPETILLGTNPAAPSRELYLFRKLPEQQDNLLLIHYRWY